MDGYRLTHTRYATDMSGFGAYKAGGRWNPKGYHALYLSEHPCGAILETLIHMPPQIVPDDFSLVHFKLSEKIKLKTIKEDKLPEAWRQRKYDLAAFQDFGKKHLFDVNLPGLYIPSSVAYPSRNFILNPRHPVFTHFVHIVDIKPYVFDPRLVQLFQTEH